jgi:hypothetical protein
MAKTYPGIEISPKDLANSRYLTIPYSVNLRYRWSTGAAMGRFLAELKNGRIIGRKCDRCKRVLVPPRMFCEKDFVQTSKWVYVKDAGTVDTYSVSYIAADASRLEKPLIVAVIRLDGTSGEAGILHILNGIDPKDVMIGMRVKAVWKPKRRRVGAITDIRYFTPAR